MEEKHLTDHKLMECDGVGLNRTSAGRRPVAVSRDHEN
jgi:hypothetical protein